MWIVFTAIVLYQVTVRSGRFEDLRATFHLISDDPRVQAIIIAFCFGGLLEALAGFGAPVAITGVMLMALGFSPLRAAAVVLLANTAPVAFGAIGTPIITAGALTGIPYTGDRGLRRTPDADPRGLRPAAARAHGGRPARRAPDVAGRRGRRCHLRLLPVALSDVHLGRAHRHHRLARRAGRGGPLPQGLAAHRTRVGARDAPPRARARPRLGGSELGRLNRLDSLDLGRFDPGSEGSVGPRAVAGGNDYTVSADELEARARSLTPGRIRWRSSPTCSSSSSSRSPSSCAGQGLVGQTDLKIGWPGLSGEVLDPRRHAEPLDDLHARPGSAPRAPCCSSARSSSPSSTASAWRVGQGAGGDGAQDAVRLPHRRLGARPGLRHELLRPDDHDRHVDRRDRRARSPTSARRSGGSAPPSRARTRARTPCSPRCSRARRRRPASTRPFSSPPTPRAGSSAR